MKLSNELTTLLYQKHSLENGLGNLLEVEINDAFDIIFSYKMKIGSMEELIVIYKNILSYYEKNTECLINFDEI